MKFVSGDLVFLASVFNWSVTAELVTNLLHLIFHKAHSKIVNGRELTLLSGPYFSEAALKKFLNFNFKKFVFEMAIFEVSVKPNFLQSKVGGRFD